MKSFKKYRSITPLTLFLVVAIAVTQLTPLSSANSARHSAALSSAHKSQVYRLKALDPASSIQSQGHGIVNLNGEMRIGTAKLSAMSNSSIRELLDLTKALRNAGRKYSNLSPYFQQKFKEFSKQRFRGQAHFAMADQFLSDCGISSHAIFSKMDDSDRTRLFDLAIERIPSGDTDVRSALSLDVKKRFSDYAISRHPRSVEDFAAYYQLARSVHARRIFKMKDSTRAINELRTPAFLLHTRNTESAIRAQIKPHHVGKTVLNLRGKSIDQVNDRILISQIRSRRIIPFSSKLKLSYHSLKHHDELPHRKRAKSRSREVSAYMRSATEILRARHSYISSILGQDGRSKTIQFSQFGYDKGKPYSGLVIVRVDAYGNATVATYIPKGDPKCIKGILGNTNIVRKLDPARFITKVNRKFFKKKLRFKRKFRHGYQKSNQRSR